MEAQVTVLPVPSYILCKPGDTKASPEQPTATQPPPHWMVSYCRNESFTGRSDIITALSEAVEEENHRRIALQGLGGAGYYPISSIVCMISETSCTSQ